MAPPGEFDAVLLDAPCSATGTVRRHPDVLWTKTAEDVVALARLQERLIAKALPMAEARRHSGLCQLLDAEGRGRRRGGAGAVAGNGVGASANRASPPGIDGAWIAADGDLRTLPHHLPAEAPATGGMDGFFACRLRRV